MAAEGNNKIYSTSILEAFSFLNKMRNTEPFLLYSKKDIHNFLNEKYNEKKNLFSDNFKLEVYGNSAFFPEFEVALFFHSKSNLNNELEKVVKISFDNYKFLEELDKPSLEFSLNIGIELDKRFGCNQDGIRDFRTRIENIPISYSK